MIRRIARLVAAEALKIVSHRFFFLSVALLIFVIPLWAHLHLALHGKEETVWRGFHAYQLFAYGLAPGLKIATFLVLIYTCMLFAGEFDRGTIKLLLTRPVTRTDLFLAKCATAVLVTAFFTGLAICVSLIFGLSRGELGPVWDDQSYTISSTFQAIQDHAVKAVLLVLLPTLAAAFLGLLISSLTESSGYAVAGGLVFYIVLDSAVSFLSKGAASWFFNYYPGRALEALGRFAEGTSERWGDVMRGWGPALVPLITAAVFAAAAFVRFRSRDITA
ncbi:MAG: ABC transporter permease [Planctomycetota bacterium]|jgi:ABC-type transport system involved in multi-copper enzyme maturation permease subunit